MSTQPSQPLWEKCFKTLESEVSAQEFNTWLRPLQWDENSNKLTLLAPNHFVLDWVSDNFRERIKELLDKLSNGTPPTLSIEVGTKTSPNPIQSTTSTRSASPSPIQPTVRNDLNPKYTFSTFVEGDTNRFAKAAALQCGDNPGKAYNPLLIYGDVGLGKTHLMQAVGNLIKERNPNAQILYHHSERFVAEMVKALQTNKMDAFKTRYRSLNALLIDDIQFLAGKERSQEEFFHTFNALLESNQQIILTSDKYPKEIAGLEERLKSRLGWGLTVAIEPPELETRVAILLSKAAQSNTELPDEVAFFIAKRIQSNVRELEGALKRIIANAHFTGRPITLDFARDALKDLLAVQAKLVSIDNIQKTVAEFYKIKLAELLSKKRNRCLARARQIAMTLTKELTNHSLPEIGDAFGGRDHTTVLHACRKIKELMTTEPQIKEDYISLIRVLST